LIFVLFSVVVLEHCRFPNNDFNYDAQSILFMAHWTEKGCASREHCKNLVGPANNKIYYELAKISGT